MCPFKNLLQNNLTVANYEQLPEKLGITANKLSINLKDPRKFEIDHIRVFSEILGKDPLDLIFEYRLGFLSLSANDLDLIAQEQGMNIDVIPNVA